MKILQWPDHFAQRVVAELPAIRAGGHAPHDLLSELQATGLVDRDARLTALGAKLAYHLAEYHGQAGSSQARELLATMVVGRARILDIGCGAGQTLFHLRGCGVTECIGIDHDLEALTWGRRMQTIVGAPTVAFLCASGERIPLGDGAVTHVFSRVALNYMHQRRLVTEAVRVLRPGGILFCQVENVGHDLKLLRTARNPREAAGKLYELLCGGVTALTGLQRPPHAPLAAQRIFACVHRLRKMLRALRCDIIWWQTTARYAGFPAGTALVARKPSSRTT